MEKVKIGVIGCGNISGAYFGNITGKMQGVCVDAVCELIPERAQYAYDNYTIGRVISTDELINDPEIQIVLNITTPPDHYALCKQALLAGKSVHVEKPLSIEREQGRELVAIAQERALFLGCAPDTFLGGGIQTCRKLIDDGWIGTPICGSVSMICAGHEGWHPDPAFYYKKGAGPVFDMGPYYLTALVNLLGPVEYLYSDAKITYPVRTITSEPKYGEKVEVEVPTHVTGILSFKSGPVVTMTMSFDVWSAEQAHFDIYGTEGTLRVPDPNTFGGPVLIRRKGEKDWREIPLLFGYAENSRGVGLADMARCIREGLPQGGNRCSGELAFHVLDIMCALHEGSPTGKKVKIKSTVKRPAPMDSTEVL